MELQAADMGTDPECLVGDGLGGGQQDRRRWQFRDHVLMVLDHRGAVLQAAGHRIIGALGGGVDEGGAAFLGPGLRAHLAVGDVGQQLSTQTDPQGGQILVDGLHCQPPLAAQPGGPVELVGHQSAAEHDQTIELAEIIRQALGGELLAHLESLLGEPAPEPARPRSGRVDDHQDGGCGAHRFCSLMLLVGAGRDRPGSLPCPAGPAGAPGPRAQSVRSTAGASA